MADISTPLSHLKDMPGPNPNADPAKGQPSDFNTHKAADGLGCEGWPLVYRDAVFRNWVFSNDMSATINNPLRAVINTPSAEISSFTTQQEFSKSITIPAGALNVAGAMLRVRCGGKLSTHSTPGSWSLLGFLGGTVQYLRTDATPLLASQTDRVWHAEGGLLVVTPGVSGVMVHTSGPVELPSPAPVLYQIPVTATFNLTVAILLRMFVSGTVSNAANKITMTWMTVEIAYCDLIV